MAEPLISRKEQIRNAARNMFKERGYAASSMRDLAKEVGIEPASLYNHIASKQDILKEVCFEMAQEFFDNIELIRVLPISAAARLKKAIDSHVQVISANVDASSVFFNEWRHLEEPALSEFKRMRQRYEHEFREILKEGINMGEFRMIDIKLSTFTILSSLNATYDLLQNPQSSNIDSEEIAEKISLILLKGISKNQ